MGDRGPSARRREFAEPAERAGQALRAAAGCLAQSRMLGATGRGATEHRVQKGADCERFVPRQLLDDGGDLGRTLETEGLEAELGARGKDGAARAAGRRDDRRISHVRCSPVGYHTRRFNDLPMLDPAREPICGEGYGPGGTAVIVTCRGSERVPSEAAVREAFRAEGGRRGAPGSVAYLFRPVGLLRYAGEERLSADAERAGAEEWLATGTSVLVCTDPGERDAVEASLHALGYTCQARGSGWRAMEPVMLTMAQRARHADLVARLAAIDGVGHVYSNAQNTDELLAPV